MNIRVFEAFAGYGSQAMAGNSIVVSCLYHIFFQMFVAEPPKRETRQITIFDYL